MPVLTFATGPGGVLDSEQFSPLLADVDYNQPDAISPAPMKSGSAYHSGGDIWLLGQGPGSERVRGFLDNTDICKIIAAQIAGE